MRRTVLLLLLLPFCGNLLYAQDYKLNLKAQVVKGFSGLSFPDFTAISVKSIIG